jgi:hypothetical protein
MTTYAITAVEIDERSDLVTRVKWGSVDTGNNVWIVEPEEVDIEQVVQAIGAGDDVYTIYAEGETDTVLGPRVELTRDASGRESIMATGPAMEGRALADLPRILTH